MKLTEQQVDGLYVIQFSPGRWYARVRIFVDGYWTWVWLLPDGTTAPTSTLSMGIAPMASRQAVEEAYAKWCLLNG